jgi:SAM-dependent methyltransferase
MITFRRNNQKDHFDNCIAYHKQANYPYNPYNWEVVSEVEMLIRLANLNRDMRILEIGSGFGHYTIPILFRGFKIDCLDMMPGMFEALRKNCEFFNSIQPNKLILSDIKTFIPREHYDAVICFNTLHHLATNEQELEHVFKRIKLLLKPGGVVAFREPRDAWTTRFWILASFSMDLYTERGMKIIREDILKRTLAKCGYIKVKIYDTKSLFPVLIFKGEV